MPSTRFVRPGVEGTRTRQAVMGLFNWEALVWRRASRSERWPMSGRPRGDDGALYPPVETPVPQRQVRVIDCDVAGREGLTVR